MDPKLAEVYGTNKVDETDVEALATAELTSKLAAADEVDLDGMSDEEAEALASEIVGGDDQAAEGDEQAEEPVEEQEEKTASDEEQPMDEAQEKIAEADYLGRVMAHAYVNERREIEKQAAAKEKKAGAKMDAAKAGAKKAGGKVMEHVKAHGKHMGGAAAAAGAAGFAAGRKSKKASAENLSALDQLALARAQEILKENGIEEQEKKSSIDEEKAALLAQKVEERAQKMLADAGYTFEEKTEEKAE